jgi:hypothetical protein
MGSKSPEMTLVFRLNKSYILNNCNNAIIYDFTPAYLKPPLQIHVPHLHKAMSPNVTGDTVTCNKINKGNNKITELRTILQRESQNS